mmetsp:Transcript_10148/g.23743  ORF Transcript_10148/g.23743 Transcript_10148/m.23743 type:complete len:84 (-) Transcript_10148:261-512(-)
MATQSTTNMADKDEYKTTTTLQKKEIDYVLLTPIVWGPCIPLIRHVLRKQPQAVRFNVYMGAIAVSLAHGFFCISRTGAWTTR